MDLVCFDTQIIIWGVKKQATIGQENNIEKAKYLIKLCEQDKIDVIVPSVVVAEILCGLEPDSRNPFVELMHHRFIAPPFDTQAALQFAHIWRNKRQIQGEIGISRAEMKADFMIIATAVVRGAECIYSEDVGLKKFAQDYIDVRPLPNIPPMQMSIEDIVS